MLSAKRMPTFSAVVPPIYPIEFDLALEAKARFVVDFELRVLVAHIRTLFGARLLLAAACKKEKREPPAFK